MRLIVDHSLIDALAAVAAASLQKDVSIQHRTALNEPASVLLSNDSPITSRNAIICRICNVDPTDPLLCEYLLRECTHIQPLLKKHISTEITGNDIGKNPELERTFEELDSWLNAAPSLFTINPLSPLAIILWADILPLFKMYGKLINSRFTNLGQFFEQINEHSVLTDVAKTFEKSMRFDGAVCRTSQSKSVTKSKEKSLTQVADSKASVQNALCPLVESNESTAAAITVSEEDQARAAKSFQPCTAFAIPVHPSPKSPQPKCSGSRNILITSALPYVNNVPHLGNMIGSTLSASVFALYCKVAGHNVLSICGTDEYGTATEAKAMAEQLTPRQICDKYHELHCEIYRWFDIEFDFFGRTTTERHTEIVQELFTQLWNNGYICEDTVEQLFCEQCSKFLADRFVEGVCPFCKYEDARGDQCDKCGKLMNAVDLREPRCKMCGHSPVIRSSKHLFLDLPKIEPKLADFVEQRTTDSTSLWTANAKQISQTWLRDGLKPRCITRDLKWGVPVPLKEYADKVFYVWFDAPIGYLSITANYTPDWRRWWQPTPEEQKLQAPVELYQFMAKDNVPFHAIIFPACLLSADQGHTLVKHLLSTEYMNYEGTKFSKSRGVGVFGDGAMRSGIASNVWRFYLLYRRPETQDSAFSWDDFVLVNNSELLNNLGNFVNRALAFVARFYNSVIPDMSQLESSDTELLAQVNQLIDLYVTHLNACRLREGLRQVLAISRLGNGYFQVNQPWVAYKKEETKSRAGVVIGVAANIACLLGLLLYPYMPSVGKQIWVEQCNMPMEKLSLLPIVRPSCHLYQILPAGHHIGKPVPLFRKIEADEAARLSQEFGGDQSK